MSIDAPGWSDFSSGNDTPGEQEAAVECCYDTIGPWYSGTEDTAGSLSYVSPSNQSFWATGSLGSGFSSGPYPVPSNGRWRLWENLADCGLNNIGATDAPLLAGRTCDIQATQSAQAGRSGHSDEKSFVLEISNISPALLDGRTSGTVYFGQNSGANPMLPSFLCGTPQCWTKHGSDYFATIHCASSSFVCLALWPIPFANNYESVRSEPVVESGGSPGASSPIPGVAVHTSIRDMFANSSYLYVLANGDEFDQPLVCRINKSTLTLVDSWEITNSDFSEAGSLFVLSNDLIFILDWTNLATSSFRIGKLNTGTGITSKICDVNGCTLMSSFHASNTVGFQYAKNSFFIADDGGRIVKVNICPFAGG